MGQRKVTLVHLNGFVEVTPLVGGYLKAFAVADPELRRGWDIELHSAYVRTPASRILDHLVERQPDVVGFSVYTWNVGLVLRLVRALRGVLSPSTRYLLGGTEVMHCGERYVDRTWDTVAVCNGEGELTFRDYLRELDSGRPDLQRVGGLSFPRDGEWVTTEPHPRIRDLSEIPSPWLEDVFDEAHLREIALFETNRGCPFQCEYCYWGGAIGARVHRSTVERVKEELTYISRRGTKTVLLCDANFGIAEDDVEIAEHVAALKRERRAPSRVTFSSAKNSFERVERIAKIFADAGLLSHQAISLQTLSPQALKEAKRDNIQAETYLKLQQRLNEWGVPSFVELIWPLPGETLDSFKEGVDRLCAMGAQTLVIYQLLWLNNVGYQGRTEELGVTTLEEEDAAAGGRLVIRTRDVGYREYVAGLRFATSVLLLHTCRGLSTTMMLMNALGMIRFRDVIDAFTEWIDERAGSDDPCVALLEDARTRFEQMCQLEWQGYAVHHVLYEHRDAFDRLVHEFVAEHLAEWTEGAAPEHAELVAAAVEFDVLSRPYLYMTTSLVCGIELEHLEVVRRRRATWLVRSPFDFPALVAGLRTAAGLHEWATERGAHEIEIDHRRAQSFRMPGRTDAERYMHCQQATREITRIEPTFEVRDVAGRSE